MSKQHQDGFLEAFHCLDHDAELWATTRLGDVKIPIYRNTDARFAQLDGNCMWRRGQMRIDISDRLFDAKKLRRLKAVLIHELTHAVEYMNSPEFMTVHTEDGCTQLAQAMEGLEVLFHNLKLA